MSRTASIQHPSILKLDRGITATWDDICLNFFEDGVGAPLVCLNRKQVQRLAGMVGAVSLAKWLQKNK